MHSDTTIMMRGPLPRIVELAADVERWPEILPHYRWVTLLAGGGGRDGGPPWPHPATVARCPGG
jgi:hypothetical protein